MPLGQVPTAPSPEGLRRGGRRCVCASGIQVNSTIHVPQPRSTAAAVGLGAGHKAEHQSLTGDDVFSAEVKALSRALLAEGLRERARTAARERCLRLWRHLLVLGPLLAGAQDPALDVRARTLISLGSKNWACSDGVSQFDPAGQGISS